jgi:hypothetical protein
MLDSLCIIFMTGYFGYNDNYHPIPKETTRIEIKTKKFRTLLLKIDEQRWLVNVIIFAIFMVVIAGCAALLVSGL